ncbi:ADP-ribosylglycohydrolase family protein [Halomonas heilongjiangensis]|uniref:ADP-ribosylglycohydrolase n=1 Tax=Halomonas heilongjiangensis TaxID=1387883 RepID=A0A2N7TU55_9GAMM|nr:ADP-ribosylglycohydrolase family protein [Halomonas heilongjiangensis]PMR71715.1 ADP-ribosylglycohydrolase [Halomonas heilongjiangensis]PXX89407.1 ADP-ribosylglycohydrolase [Halomonas heilongjiangensis]
MNGTLTIEERFTGCLLGGAVGDALGAPVEFLSRRQILDRFGAKGISEYAPSYGGLGWITDDTQMTLFTAEGLLRSWVRSTIRGITHYPSIICHAYMRWLLTQGEKPAPEMRQLMADSIEQSSGWLFQQRALHDRRAPGNTCLSALRSVKGLGDIAKNDSKGCGGVMRVAPIGLFGHRAGHHQEVFELGCDAAAITHGHPTGQLPAGVLALMINLMAAGQTIRQALEVAKECLEARDDRDDTHRAIELAEKLAATDTPHHAAIAQLGQGWVAEEALAISIYCALVAKDFRHGVMLAVNHDGDSDSTGAITGNLLGVLHGAKAIPDEWLEPLELREVITELAKDLASFQRWDIGEYGGTDNDRVWEKYPGY